MKVKARSQRNTARDALVTNPQDGDTARPHHTPAREGVPPVGPLRDSFGPEPSEQFPAPTVRLTATVVHPYQRVARSEDKMRVQSSGGQRRGLIGLAAASPGCIPGNHVASRTAGAWSRAPTPAHGALVFTPLRDRVARVLMHERG